MARSVPLSLRCRRRDVRGTRRAASGAAAAPAARRKWRYPLEIIHSSMGLKLLNYQLSSVQKQWIVDDYKIFIGLFKKQYTGEIIHF